MVGLKELVFFCFVHFQYCSWKFKELLACLVLELFINYLNFWPLFFIVLVHEFFSKREFQFVFFIVLDKTNLLLQLTWATFFIKFLAYEILTSYLFGFILVFMEFWNSLNLVFFSKKVPEQICRIYLLEIEGRKEY